MTTWWLLTLSGLLGSSHCIGMCGGFAALIGLNSSSLARNLRSQLLYSAGRLMSYITLGAVAGFAGRQTIMSLPGMVYVPAVLCLLSGAYLLREGLVGLGYWPSSIKGHSTTGCLLRPLFSAIIRQPGLRKAFLAGILTGFLPCGLVYAFVSLAASTGDLLQGMATMAAFGLGTVPLMLLAGTGTSLMSWSVRDRLLKLSAICVLATGLLTIARGAAFAHTASSSDQPKCPFCAARPAADFANHMRE
jgi:sulfite exporter TauE/SafE